MSIEAMKQALEALRDLLDQAEPPPDKNCSCHIAPPCSDCVNYSGLRYAIKQANDSITSLRQAIAEAEKQEQNFCPRVVFPTMLRKMWSGGEVQAWLDENVNKENT